LLVYQGQGPEFKHQYHQKEKNVIHDIDFPFFFHKKGQVVLCVFLFFLFCGVLFETAYCYVAQANLQLKMFLLQP
jgi:hypothetical protein